MDSTHHSILPIPIPALSCSSYQTMYPSIRWNDVVGMQEAKKAMQEIIYLPTIIDKQVFTGIRALPSTLLLYGPPGTGKTMLVYATAYESRRKLYTVTPSIVLSKWAGESEKTLRKIFDDAAGILPSFLTVRNSALKGTDMHDEDHSEMNKSFSQSTATPTYPYSSYHPKRSRISFPSAPSHRHGEPMDQSTLPIISSNDDNGIIFIDEIDAFVIRRDGTENHQSSASGGGGGGGGEGGSIDIASRRLLNEFLLLLSDLPTRYPNILVIAATNRIQDCDQAILRRFQRRIYCSLPLFQDRYHLMLNILKDIPVDMGTKDFEEIAEVTDGWNNSDLRALCSEAAMIPVREIIQDKLDSYLQENGKEDKSPPPFIIRTDDPHSPYGDRSRTTVVPISSTPSASSAPLITSIRPLSLSDFLQALRTIRPSYIDGTSSGNSNNNYHQDSIPSDRFPMEPITDNTVAYDTVNDESTDTTSNPSVCYSLSSKISTQDPTRKNTFAGVPLENKRSLASKPKKENMSLSLTTMIVSPLAGTVTSPSYLLLPALPSGMNYVAVRTDHETNTYGYPTAPTDYASSYSSSTLYDTPFFPGSVVTDNINSSFHHHPVHDDTANGLPSTIHASINAFVHRFDEETEQEEDENGSNKDHCEPPEQ